MGRSPISRRRLISTSLGTLAGLSLAGDGGGFPFGVAAPGRAAEAVGAASQTGPNRLPRMVHEYFVAEVRRIMQRRDERIAALRTKADAERYVEDVRNKVADCFGPWPERTPLNPRVTGTVERDAYRIENVVFESRPEFYVTANLYVPKGLKAKAPGVVGSCGHSNNGKAHEAYQSFAQGLALQGYVVLLFDPIGQGERLQLPDENLKPRLGVGVSEHMMVGNQQFLVGEFFGSWRAWDAMRALDYLLSREEVDPRHVGITGNSGGGTMTTWLCGVERRWTMAAPSCFVTSFLNNLENELPADTEQCPPRALRHGLDHGDFLACMAPKPIVILTQEQDFFDVRGSERTFAQLKHLYELLGAERNLTLFTGPGGHGYARDAREAMYACFQRAVGRGESPVVEPQLTIEEDRVLQCTPRGQVAELKSRPVYSFTNDIAERLGRERGEPSGRALRDKIVDLSRLPTGDGPLQSTSNDGLRYRILRPRSVKEAPLPSATTFLIDSDDGRQTVVYRLYEQPNLSRPPKLPGLAVLYVAHDSSDVELRAEPLVREVFQADPTATLYACDVAGLGESRPNTCGENSYRQPYGCDYFYSSHAIMLGGSYVALRMADLRTAIDFVCREGGHRQVHVVAKGYGAIPAALLAVVDDRVVQVTLKNPPPSYRELASADIYRWPLSSLLPDVLRHFDLPDVYRELEKSKRLRIVDPIGADAKFAAT